MPWSRKRKKGEMSDRMKRRAARKEKRRRNHLPDHPQYEGAKIWAIMGALRNVARGIFGR